MIGLFLLYSSIAIAEDIASYDFSSSSIEYTVHGSFTQYHRPHEILDITGKALKTYLIENDINEVHECYSLSVDIFYTSHKRLNSLRKEARFGKEIVDYPNIQGVFFSPAPWKKDETEIWVANSLTSHRRVDMVLGHEVAHYWWERLCLGNSISLNQEDFAEKIEDKIHDTINSKQ